MSYRDDLNKARTELADLLRNKEGIEVQIAKQKRKIAALAELCDQGEFSPQSVDMDLGGITDAVRTAMRSSRKEWLNVGEIKTRLEELGFPVKDYKAPVATISTVLKRLVEDDEISIDKRNKEYAEYKWVGPRRQISALLKKS